MKKMLLIVTAIIFVAMGTGCGNEKEVMKTCTLTQKNVAENYTIVNEYKIYGNGKVAKKVVTVETVTSSDQDILDDFEEQVKNLYETNNKVYGGFSNKTTNENGKLVSETTVDYSKLDIKKFVADNSVMKNFVNSKNEMLIDGLIQIYTATGATCN